MSDINDADSYIELAADIVSAYVSNNAVSANELVTLLAEVHGALQRVNKGEVETVVEPLKPAVPPKKSVMPDYIVCLEDGKKFKSLKRHLGVHYGLTPDAYRAKWGLPSDYPMVAPNYAASRSQLAKSIGLGRKPPVAEAAKPTRARKAKTTA